MLTPYRRVTPSLNREYMLVSGQRNQFQSVKQQISQYTGACSRLATIFPSPVPPATARKCPSPSLILGFPRVPTCCCCSSSLVPLGGCFCFCFRFSLETLESWCEPVTHVFYLPGLHQHQAQRCACASESTLHKTVPVLLRIQVDE